MDAPRESSSEGDKSSPHRILERLRANRPSESGYRIDTEIGRGGLDAVFKVWDDDSRRSLEMRIGLSTRNGSDSGALDEVILGRFLEEAQVTGRLDHRGDITTRYVSPRDSHASEPDCYVFSQRPACLDSLGKVARLED